ncbi:MAG: exodeoxyribonuclease VII small subunit [Candidatus Aminicenantia bacterium]
MKDKTFEEALLELEKIVEKLEAGDLPLTESLKLFEEGVALSRFLREELDKTEKRVEILLKGEGKELRKEPFELEKEIEKKSNNE